MAEYEFTTIEFDAWGPHKGNDGGFRLRWTCEGTGFGETTFVRMKDGTIRCDNETMGSEFIKALMDSFIENYVQMDWVVKDGKMVYTR